jgi:hypothetical protein
LEVFICSCTFSLTYVFVAATKFLMKLRDHSMIPCVCYLRLLMTAVCYLAWNDNGKGNWLNVGCRNVHWVFREYIVWCLYSYKSGIHVKIKIKFTMPLQILLYWCKFTIPVFWQRGAAIQLSCEVMFLLIEGFIVTEVCFRRYAFFILVWISSLPCSAD